MKKLLLILLVLIAVFTYINTFDKAEALEISRKNHTETSMEIPIEIVHN